MAVTTNRNPRWPIRLVAVAAVGVVCPGQGRAFFFDYGPTTFESPTPRNPSLISTEQREIVNRDWMPVPPDPPLPPTEVPPGGHVPEPATGVAAAIGLGLVGLARRRFHFQPRTG